MTRSLAYLSIVLIAIGGLPANAAPQIHSVRPTTSETVGLYEKYELRIDLEATYSNPFDPEQIDLWAEFTSPSGRTWKIWGFYHPSSWASLWMVRF